MEQLSRQQPVRHMLQRVSWLLLVRGGCCVTLGALALAAADFPALVQLASAYAIADGFLALALGRAHVARGNGTFHPLWPLLLSGFAGLASGALASSRVDASAGFMVLGAGLFTRGVFEVLAAIVLRETGYDERLLGIAGLSALVTGALAATCAFDVLAWRILIGAHAAITGAAMIVLALRVSSTADVEISTPSSTRSTAMHPLHEPAEPPAALR